MFGAVTGNLSSLENLSLWRDTTGDGTVDTKVLDQSQNSTATVLVFFDTSVAQNRVLAAGQSSVFEVRGDIVAGASTPSDIQLGFKIDLANYLSGHNQTSNTALGGIETDGLCLFTCEINVTTSASTLWHIIAGS